MNKFKKYCPNVFIAECEEEYNKKDIIALTTKYGKEVLCEVFNLIESKNGKFYYSIVRAEDKSYAEKKAERYEKSAENHHKKSNEAWEKSKEGRDFLVLAEPIKIGHHSEKRHRALIERNAKRMDKSVKELEFAEEKKKKAEYWREKTKEINLSNPESLEYYTFKLQKAKDHHKGLKDGSIPKEHHYSVQYANKEVKDLEKKVNIAKKLWSES